MRMAFGYGFEAARVERYDVAVGDETQVVQAAKQYLSFFQGRVQAFGAPDVTALRDVVPENRLRVYDSRAALQGIADTGSLLELRTGFGKGIHTALARIEAGPWDCWPTTRCTSAARSMPTPPNR